MARGTRWRGSARCMRRPWASTWRAACRARWCTHAAAVSRVAARTRPHDSARCIGWRWSARGSQAPHTRASGAWPSPTPGDDEGPAQWPGLVAAGYGNLRAMDAVCRPAPILSTTDAPSPPPAVPGSKVGEDQRWWAAVACDGPGAAQKPDPPLHSAHSSRHPSCPACGWASRRTVTQVRHAPVSST